MRTWPLRQRLRVSSASRSPQEKKQSFPWRGLSMGLGAAPAVAGWRPRLPAAKAEVAEAAGELFPEVFSRSVQRKLASVLLGTEKNRWEHCFWVRAWAC